MAKRTARTVEDSLVPDTTATANSKCSLNPRQIHKKSHTTELFTLVSFTRYNVCSQQKIIRHTKRQFEETKQVSEHDSDMADHL